MVQLAGLATAIIEANSVTDLRVTELRVTDLRVTDALAAYEAIMLPRAARNAAGAHEGLTISPFREASEAARTVALRSLRSR